MAVSLKENLKQHKKISILYCVLVFFILILPLNLLSKLFLVLSVSNFTFCFFYFKNIFNLPGIFMSMFFLQIGCSQAKLTSVEQDDFHFMTWITLFTVTVVFYFFSFFVLNKIEKKIKSTVTNDSFEKIKFNKKRLLLANAIFFVVEIILYVYIYSKLETIPAFSDAIRAFVLPSLVGNLGMTVLSAPLFFVIINSVYCIIEKKYTLMILNFLYITMLVTLGSRICIFISTFTVLFFALMIMYFYPQRRKELIVLCMLIVGIVSALMTFIPILRTQVYLQEKESKKVQISWGNDYYSSIYYSKNSSESTNDNRPNNVENQKIKIPSQLLPVWVNFSTEMHGFNGLVEKLFVSKDYKYGKMFLTGTFNFISKYFIEKPDCSNTLKIPWINVCTFLQEPYLDFGIFGVTLFIFAFAVLGTLLYALAIRKRSLFIMVYYSYIAMCTVFFIFVNHFYYSTFIINTIVIYAMIKFFTNDKVGLIRRKKYELIK